MTVQTPSSPYWQLRLGAAGEAVTGLEDIGQCLRIIVTTQPGSDPLRPEFGCDILPDMDRPPAQALPSLIRKISKAVARFEPRATLEKVQVLAGDQPHARTLRLVWHPATESQGATASSTTSQTTEVVLDSRYVRRSEVGFPGGVVPLGTSGLVPNQYLPSEGYDFGEVQ